MIERVTSGVCLAAHLTYRWKSCLHAQLTASVVAQGRVSGVIRNLKGLRANLWAVAQANLRWPLKAATLHRDGGSLKGTRDRCGWIGANRSSALRGD